MDGSQIRQRFEAKWSERKTVEQQWDLVTRLVLPFRGDMYREYLTEHSVEWTQPNREIYDSTAVDACQTLAASIHGSLTTPMVRWFELRFRDEQMNAMSEAQEWLESCADRCYAALQDSNFNLEVAETYLDLTGYGTGCLILEPGAPELEEWAGLDFAAIPMRECYFEADHRGDIVRLYRRLEWSALQIIEALDPDRTHDKGIPDYVYEADDKSESGGVDEKFDVIFAVFDRPEKRRADVSRPLAPTERPFGHKYVMRRDGEEMGEEGGYYEMPAFLPRWRKVAGSQWGFSPAIVAMGDIRSLNELVQMKLDAIERAIDPATLTTERGLLSDFDFSPGGLTVLRDLDDIRPYESAARVDWAAMEEARIIGQIRRAFFVDQLELKESPAMTATEVTVRYELMQRLLGPTLGRLQNDLLEPLIQRTFNLLWRGGQLEEMPQEMRDLDTVSGQLDIEYVGPMARSQKADRVAAIERWTGYLVQQAAAHPRLEEVLDLLDTDVTPRTMADFLGVPATSVRSETEVKKAREQREQMQQQAQQLQMAQAAAGAAKDGAQAMQAMPQEVAGGPTGQLSAA